MIRRPYDMLNNDTHVPNPTMLLIARILLGVGILALMLVLLVAVGKSALIENLPMWAAYIVLFIVNFTNLMEEKQKV